MSISVKLNLLNREYNLLELTYSLKQEVDDFGRPCSETQCGLINLLVDATNNTGLVEHIGNVDNPLQGKISFFNVVTDQKIKEIEFSNGFIIYYEEMFSTESSVLCKEKLTISAQNIRLGKVKFSNNWLV